MASRIARSTMRFIVVVMTIVTGIVIIAQVGLQVITALQPNTPVYTPQWLGIAGMFLTIVIGKGGEKWVDLHETGTSPTTPEKPGK